MPDLFLWSGLPALTTIEWNPRHWGSWPFIVIISISLLAYFLLPPATTRVQTLLAEVTLLLPAIILYFVVRGHVDAHAGEAIDHAQDVINLERKLGIFVEPQVQRAVLRWEFIETSANWVYIWMHWPVVVATIIWLVLRRPRDTFAVYRNAFLLSGAIGMVIFALFPSAPPRLMPGLGFEDTVTLHSHAYRVLQPPALTNPFAAMPSLHFGWNLLVGIAIMREARHPAARVFGAVMPLLMYAAIVLTANHYILDGIAGGLLTTSCLLFFIWVSNAREIRLPRPSLPRWGMHEPGG